MKYLKLFILIFFSICTSCTNLSDTKIEQPFISLIDIREADYIEKSLLSDKRLQGKIKVTPYKNRTLVEFDSPSRPGNEKEVRKSMKRLRKHLTKERGREANEIIFAFPEVVLKE